MSISIMKFIDEYLGRIAVGIITLFRSSSGKKKTHKKNISKKILFIKFWGIGSIILTSPAVRSVKAAYPGSKISYLTLKNNSDICGELELADEIITIDISGPVAFISDLIRKILLLRKTGFNIVFDFEFYTYFSAIIVSFLDCGRSYGFDNLKNNRKILYSDVILFNDNIHTKDNFLGLVSADNSVCPVASAHSGFPDRDTTLFDHNGTLRIVVNVNASKLAFERRMPEKNFIQIIDHVSRKSGCMLYLTGSADEISYVGRIYSKLNNKDRVSDLSGKTSVHELIALIRSSACLITNDSGPLHIASSLNIPVVAFFGPESPKRYGPLSDKNIVFYKGLECSPCMSISNSKTVNCIFDSPKCMEQFDMNMILNKIDILIAQLCERDQTTLSQAKTY